MNEINYSLINEKLDLILRKIDSNPEDVSKIEINELDLLIDKIEKYKKESIDPNFNKSLDNSLKEAFEIKNKIKSLSEKVDWNYGIYLENKKILEENKQQRQTTIAKTEKPVLIKNKDVLFDVEKDKQNIKNKIKRKEDQSQTKMEYKIGGELFGFLGAILIIISMVTLGRTLLPEFMQGIAMFFIPVFVLMLGEFIEKKFSEKFAQIITAIGVSTGYIAILINYLYMETINGWIALLLSIGVTIITLFLSKIKDNTIIKIISLIGFYISLLPMGEATNSIQPLILSGCLLFVSAIDILIKTKENKLFDYLSVIFNFFAVLIISFSLLDISKYGNIESTVINTITLFALLGGSFLVFFKSKKDKVFNIFMFVSLIIEILILTIMFNTLDFGFIGFFLIPVLFYYLEKDKKAKWIYIYPVLMVFLPAFFIRAANMLTVKNIASIHLLVGFMGYLLLNTVLQKDLENVNLKLLNTLSLIAFMISGTGFEGIYIVPFFVFSFIIFAYFDNYREWSSFFIIPLSSSYVISMLIDTNLDELVIFICCLQILTTIFTYMFTKIPLMINEKNYIAIRGMMIYTALGFFLNLFNFNDIFLPWVASLVCTMFTLTMINSENTHFENLDKDKLKIYAIVATLFVFIIPDAPGVLISILTILLAVVAIYIGFLKLDKGLRTYGLGLSLVMIIKLMLFDFNNNSDISKVVLFLIGGILILSISYIYIKLDKKTIEN